VIRPAHTVSRSIPANFRLLLGHEPTAVELEVPADLRFALFGVTPEQAEALGERLVSMTIHVCKLTWGHRP
jgi:hypothetical protein